MHLPDEADLARLFEAHPTLLDAGVGRAYNTLTWEVPGPTGRCTVTLVPGYSEVSIRFTSPTFSVDLSFDEVQALTVLDDDTFRLALPKGHAVIVKLRARSGVSQGRTRPEGTGPGEDRAREEHSPAFEVTGVFAAGGAR